MMLTSGVAYHISSLRFAHSFFPPSPLSLIDTRLQVQRGMSLIYFRVNSNLYVGLVLGESFVSPVDVRHNPDLPSWMY